MTLRAEFPTPTGLFATYEAASDTGVTRLAPLDRLGLPSIICEAEQF